MVAFSQSATGDARGRRGRKPWNDMLVLGNLARQNRQRHADGDPGFVKLMDDLLALQGGDIHLRAPAIDLTSAELLERSKTPDTPRAWTHSIARRAALACGKNAPDVRSAPGC